MNKGENFLCTLNFLIDAFDLLCMFLMNQVNHLIVSHYTDIGYTLSNRLKQKELD